MTINETHRTQIFESFEEIRKKLDNSELISKKEYDDLNELMVDCENELNKSNPNKSKIGACLSGIGFVIQGIAIVGQAYQTLKTFVPMFGGPPLP